MLVTLREVLNDARKNQYAVGLFNTVNLEMAKGVLAAAEELKSPVIIGTAEVLTPYASLKELAPMLVSFAKCATVPVVLHFDHGLTEDMIFEAIRLGFSSIMYDCSTDNFEGNCAKVARMTEFAHKNGISVEGELGHVGANSGAAEGGDAADTGNIYTEPVEAKRFFEATGVDALAISIGTAHGAYKSTPKLDINRLKEISDTVNVPLVLHGGSGLSDDDFQNTIKNGIAKVNIFTDINCAAAKAAATNYSEGKGMTDLMPAITEAIKEETAKKMMLFGSANRA